MMINEAKMDRIMLDLGHSEAVLGTEYLRAAARIYAPGMSFTNELYPAIAEAANSTPARVERAMRHSIESAWQRGSNEAQLKYFGSSSPETGRPRVSEYVARMARLCREGLEY